MYRLLISLLLTLYFTTPAVAGNLLYGTEIWGTLVTIDTTSGKTTIVGNTGQQYVDDMAFTGKDFYAVSFLTVGTRLMRIKLDGSSTVLNDITPYKEVQGIAYGNNTLYGVESQSCNCLLKIDEATSTPTVIGALGYQEVVGIEFAPDGTLYGIQSQPVAGTYSKLLKINITTGKATMVAAINYPGINTIAIDSDGAIYGASEYSKSFVKINTDGTYQVVAYFQNAIRAISFDPPVPIIASIVVPPVITPPVVLPPPPVVLPPAPKEYAVSMEFPPAINLSSKGESKVTIHSTAAVNTSTINVGSIMIANGNMIRYQFIAKGAQYDLNIFYRTNTFALTVGAKTAVTMTANTYNNEKVSAYAITKVLK